MNNNYDVNSAIQSIMQMRNAGQNPQAIMQMMMQQNPQMAQLMTQFQNMSKGQNPKQFIAQLAKQRGVSQENIQQILNIFS